MDRWQRTEALFESAVKLRPADREAYLRQACGDDAELYREVSSLLEHHDSASGPESWAAQAVEQLIAPGRPVGEHSRLAPGAMLGPYRIEGLLGAGGMGEVYKATDTRLQRAVALKILPRAVSDDAPLRQRLEREARAVAALHHPHICILHDVGRDGNVEFLVMEYLEGETLAARLTRGPLPLDEVFRYAIEIGEALSETHAQRIVHRDLKPGNIMLTKSGAKLLDFGLATLQRETMGPAGSPGSDRPVDAARASAVGSDTVAMAGTLAYMAPEQLRGERVDARTDVYAFGAILHEMLTGRKAFEADSSVGLTASLLGREPPVASGHGVPPALSVLVHRCLRKSPADRWPTTSAIVEELRRLAASRRVPLSRPQAAALAAASLLAVTLVGLFFWRLGSVRPPRPSGANGSPASILSVGNMLQLTAAERLEIDPAMSPDGQSIAYSAGTSNNMQIVVRPMAGGEARRLSSDSTSVQLQPRWSPDSRRILYVRSDGAFVEPVAGGVPVRVDSLSSRTSDGARTALPDYTVTGAAWSPDGRRIAVAYDSTMEILDLDTNRRRTLPWQAREELHHCDWAPNDRWIACAAGNWRQTGPSNWYFGNLAPSSIVLLPLDGGPTIEVTSHTAQDRTPVWSADASRLYFVSTRHGPGDVYSVDIGDDGGVGEPVRVTTGLGAYAIAFAADRKHLAYAAFSTRSNVWSLDIPTRGPVTAVGARQITSGNQAIEAVTISPDGRWLLYDSNLNGNSDIYRMPLTGGPVEQLTSHPSDEFAPEVSPDGTMLSFFSWRTKSRDVFIKPIAGGDEEQVTNTPGHESFAFWSRDGRSLLFFDQALGRDGLPLGQFIVRRDSAGRWGAPVHSGSPSGLISLMWMPGGGVVYARDGGIELADPAFRARRVVYRPDTARGDPGVLSLRPSEDGKTIYFKSLDAEGRASFWSVPVTGGRPSHLVDFDDPMRTSNRYEFTIAGGRFYFTIQEHRSNIWIADVTER